MIAILLAAVSISSEPSFLRLGTDNRAVVRVRASALPTVTVSAGKLSAPRATGDGVFELDYTPPDEALPQVAIVAVLAAGDAGWLAIPLWGQGDALVKTRPHGRISVDIGTQTFGPAVADAQGQAIVPVVVPPGITHARQGDRAIDLHVPPARTIHLALGSALPADRAQTIPVYVVAVDPSGEPRSGAPIRLRAGRGELSAARERAPGLYEASLTLAPGAMGEIAVSAALEDAPDLAADAAVRLEAGVAQTIELTSETAKLVAGEAAVAGLHARARDAAGNPPADEIGFAASFGELRSVQRGPGEWDLTLTVPPSFGGRTEVQVRAQGARASALSAIALAAAAPVNASLQLPSAPTVADGATPVLLPLLLTDQYGNAVSEAQAEISADVGSAAIARDASGLAARYVPPLLREPGDTVVVARAGTATARTRLELRPYHPFAAVSPRLGWMSNFSGFSAPLLGVEAAIRTDRYGPPLGVALEIDYALRMQTQAAGAAAEAESRIDLLLVHLSAQLRGDAGARSAWWLSLGPSAASYWTRVGVTGAPAQRGFAVAPGLQISAGFERRMRWTVPFLELRAGWISGSGLPNLSGPLRTVSLLAGVRFEAL